VSYLRCCAGCSAHLATWQTGSHAWCPKCQAKVDENAANRPAWKVGDRCYDSLKTSPIFRDLIILRIDEQGLAHVRALGDPEGKIVRPYWIALDHLVGDPNPY